MSSLAIKISSGNTDENVHLKRCQTLAAHDSIKLLSGLIDHDRLRLDFPGGGRFKPTGLLNTKGSLS